MFKSHRLAFLFFVFPFSLHGQPYPSLTSIISIENLQARSLERMVAWTNPDGSREELKIREMAIPFNRKMMDLTREYVHSVYGLDSIWLDPKMIVFHAMGDGDLKTSLEVSSFLNDQIPATWGNLSKAGRLPNGAHFIIDRDGTVICLSPPVSKDGSPSYDAYHHHWYVKRHQDGNPVAIGIENVTKKGNYTELTEAQLEADAKLARWLYWFEQGSIKLIASHHQFESDRNYENFLSAFHLTNYKKAFRTRGRKDVGTKAFLEISTRIKKSGVPLNSFFDN
jgi:hypothetical protein